MNSTTLPETLPKVRELIRRIHVAMLTTDCEGHLRSRPMSTNGDVDFDGELWFFTFASSHKVDEIAHDARVNVAFAEPRDHVYVSLSGRASLVRDPAQIKELWRPMLRAFFPKGPDDPDIALLKVSVERGEYWDGRKGWMMQLVELAKGALTGETPNLGENAKIRLPR